MMKRSADDAQPDATSEPQDERLSRAFDRAARLGIDVDPHDPLSERESAAVRAFAALHDESGTTPPAADPPDLEPPDVGRTDLGPAGTATADADPLDADGATGDPPAPTAARGDEGPLRPDAVLRGRPLSGDRLTIDDLRQVEEVEVPPTPPADAAPTSAGGDAATAVPPPVDEPDADGAPRLIDHYLLDALALAVAAGAFVTPWAWTSVVAIAALAGSAVRSLADHGPRLLPLARRALRRGLSWLRPRPIVWLPIHLVRTAVLATLVPAVVCAVWWVVEEGRTGTLVAARTGVWAHAPRTAAAIVCFMLVAGVGEAHQRRGAQVRIMTDRIGTGAALATSLALVTSAAIVVTVVPRADAGRLGGADGLAWVPVAVRADVDRLRDDLVAAELRAVAGCLSDAQGVTWRATYTVGNPLTDDDVARLTATEGSPEPGELTTAAAAMHNQLAPWVEVIELDDADTTLVTIDRSALPSGRPLVDGATVAAAERGRRIDRGVADFSRSAALSCAASPLP
jgi:hypothetical protein